MERARVILNDGQEYDAIVRNFTVECGPGGGADVTFEGVLTKHKPRNLGMEVAKVIFNNPATVVFWSDGTKTVVKCSGNDTFDPEIGLAMAICKKAFGNTGAYNEVFKKWVPEASWQGRAVSVDHEVGESGYMTDDEIVDAYNRVFGK